jgi:hypothetical protein
MLRIADYVLRDHRVQAALRCTHISQFWRFPQMPGKVLGGSGFVNRLVELFYRL